MLDERKKERRIRFHPRVSKVGDRKQKTPGSTGRVSTSGTPNECGSRYQREDPEERPMSISGKGHRGQTNTAPTHFAETSEQWANAWGGWGRGADDDSHVGDIICVWKWWPMGKYILPRGE